jgi:hypothetical protein
MTALPAPSASRPSPIIHPVIHGLFGKALIPPGRHNLEQKDLSRGKLNETNQGDRFGRGRFDEPAAGMNRSGGTQAVVNHFRLPSGMIALTGPLKGT